MKISHSHLATPKYCVMQALAVENGTSFDAELDAAVTAYITAEGTAEGMEQGTWGRKCYCDTHLAHDSLLPEPE